MVDLLKSPNDYIPEKDQKFVLKFFAVEVDSMILIGELIREFRLENALRIQLC